MEEDRDDKDVSGLVLAKKEAFHSIPKIMLTSFGSIQLVREALRPSVDGLPPTVEFLQKDEGSEVMLQAVADAFAQHVRINWDLVMQFNERHPLSFPHLVGLMEPELERERLLRRVDELEDLFRRLFYEKSQIKIDRLLWHHGGRVAITMVTFQEGTIPESFVVVCGRPEAIMQERHRYRIHASRTFGGSSTMLSEQSETTHYAANAYSLAGVDVEQIQAFADLYRNGSEKRFNAALDHLLQQTLPVWHQETSFHKDTQRLDELYRERFNWMDRGITREVLNDRIHALVKQIPTLGCTISYQAEQMTIRFRDQERSYSDPAVLLDHMPVIDQPVLVVNTPGYLSGANILVDVNNQTWLTDFATSGLAPLLWNFVTLEATIRFDQIDTNNLQAINEMEQCLVESEFNRLNMPDIDTSLRKPAKAIGAIRQHALREVGRASLPHHIGMFFQAVNRLVDFNPALHPTANELARFAHLLIAAAMIGSKIDQAGQMETSGTVPTEIGIRIDPQNREVWVDGRKSRVTGQSFTLLAYLYDHADQLCTKRDLIEEVFSIPYQEGDESQVGRLNTAIRRLRERIETEPSRPRYILTAPNGGYRLALEPESF